MFRRSLLGMALCAVLAGGVMAQQSKKPVEVVSDSSDSLGQQLVNKIKEEIISSNASLTPLRLANGDETRLQLIITTMNRHEDFPTSTVFTVVWLLVNSFDEQMKQMYPYPYYLDSMMSYCGRYEVDVECYAETIVSYTGKLSKMLPK